MNWYPNLPDKLVNIILFIGTILIVVILVIDLISIVSLVVSGKIDLLTYVNGLWGSRGRSSRPLVLAEIIFDVLVLFFILFRRKELNRRLEKGFADNPFKRDIKLAFVLLGLFFLLYHLLSVIVPQSYQPWS